MPGSLIIFLLVDLLLLIAVVVIAC